MTRRIAKDSIDVTSYVRAVDAISGQPKTALVFSDITASYLRTRGARTAIVTATLASATAAHAGGGFVEVDAANMPGLYRFDLPDAVVATGADQAVIVLTASGSLLTPIEIELVADTNALVTDIRKFVGNTREINATTGVETIMQDDGVTPFKSVSHTEPSPGLVREEVA